MKKFILPLLILILLGGSFWYYKKSTVKPVDQNISSYRNSNLGIFFVYPKKLTVTGNNISTTLHHQVPFTHHDFCDFKGEGTTTIDSLTDFNVTIHAVNKNLINTMKSESPYIPEENFLNGEVVPSPGFIDRVDFGNLKGFSIFEGAEGCGHTVYYLTVSDNKTLVIVNDFITIFSGAIDTENMTRALAVPGVIGKLEAETIFSSIVTSMIVQ